MDQIELIDKRKPREKHFLQKDGTIRAEIYNTDIHYLKDGKYVEIDNTLVKENDSYVNKSNDYKVEFKEDIKKSLMKMSKDNHYIDFKLKEKKTNIFKAGLRKLSANNITSGDIADNIKVEYQTLSNKVKETIVLQDSNYDELSFNLDTDLTLELVDGEIIAKDENGNIIFKIEKPFMFDSNNTRNDDIYYLIGKTDNGYELKLKLDDEWLKSLDRVYPVYIDPTISNASYEYKVYDTFIHPSDEGLYNSYKTYLKVGVDNENGVLRPNRTLIKFDLPTIGTGSEIVSASLLLTPYTSESGNLTETISEIHRINKDWEEDAATWANMKDNFDNNVESLLIGRRRNPEKPLEPEYYSADITNLVKKWYRDTKNQGIMIKAINEDVYVENYPKFHSNDNYYQYSDPRPFIKIAYRNQNGIISHMDYKEDNFESWGTYINTYNGNMTAEFKLSNVIRTKIPMDVNLIYNTNDVVLNNDFGYGKGFKLNLDQKIKPVIIDGREYFEFLNEYGTINYLYKKDINEEIYYDEDNLGLTLIKNDDCYVMTDKNRSQMTFILINNEYWLNEIKDSKNNILTIYRDSNNRINKITCDNSNILLTYSNNEITISSELNYSNLNYENGKITHIESKKGTITVDWNDIGLISKITDLTGISCSYEYYNNKPYRLHKYTKYGTENSIKESNSYEYGDDSTSILDNNDKYEIIIYDYSGSVKSVNILNSKMDLNSAYSTTMQYGAYSSDKNKLSSSSAPIRYVKNFLTNTSFELDGHNFTSDGDMNFDYSTLYSNSGGRSLRITSLNAGNSAQRSVSVPKGSYYTFSGYLKNSEDIVLSIGYLDKDGIYVYNSKIVKYSDEFERVDLSIYYDELASSDLVISISFLTVGTVYIDDIQLEQGEVANVYNYIDNSDFSLGLSDWELSAYDTEKQKEISNIESCFQIVSVDNVKALKVNMKPHVSSSFKKNFAINGKKGDLYTISFWYKNSGVDPIRPHAGNYVAINFKSVNEAPEYCVATSESFNSNSDRWQYFSYRDVALEDYESISLIFIQDTEVNDFLITNMSFTKNNTSGDYQYDENGNIVSVINDAAEETSYKYNSNNQLIDITNPMGGSYKYEYSNEQMENIHNISTPIGISNEIEYDENGNVISTKLINKNVESIENGKYRIRAKGCDLYLKAELNAVVLEKSKCSNTVWDIIKECNEFEIHYSVLPIYSVSYYKDKIVLSSNENNNKLLIEKNNNGSYYIAVAEEDDSYEKKYFKVNNNEIILSNLNINEPNFEFYIEFLDEEFIEEDTEYTEDGKFIKSTTDSNFNVTKYTVDPITGLDTSITNAKGIITEYNYNEKNEVNLIKSGNKQLQYTYTENDKLNDIRIGDTKYSFEYDEHLNVTKTKINDNITLVTNEYDNSGNVLAVLYGNNQKILFESDKFDRVNKIIREDDAIEYKYDCYGNVAKIISSNGTLNQYYDIAKRLLKYELNDYNVKYSYDSSNNITSKHFELGNYKKNILNTFNNELLIEQALDEDCIQYNYDSLGRIRKQILGNNHIIEYEYITNGKRTSFYINKIKHNDDIFEYKYDEVYNISEIYLNGNKIYEFTYDMYNQLIKETDYLLSKKTNYLYDNNSNLLQESIEDVETGETNSIRRFKYENQKWKCMLTEYNGTNIEYDGIGNPVSVGENINLEWMNGKMLKKYSDLEKNLNILYEYNANGIRKSKTVNGTKTEYFLENDDVIYERKNNNVIYYLYDLTGVIGLDYNGNRYYFKKNIQDDVVAILNSDNEIVAKYSYDSWGKLNSITDSNGNMITDDNHIGIINPYRYRSYYYDDETGLYYNNRRYYNPEWRRFINIDSIIGANDDLISYNLYTYCSNNPITNKDLSGNFAVALGTAGMIGAGILILGGIVYYTAKAAAPAITSLISKATTPSNKTKNNKSSDSNKSTKKDNDDTRKYEVYTLLDTSTYPPTIEYVGRTGHPVETIRRHENNKFRSHLEYKEVYSDLTYVESRMLEQILIKQCQTLHKDKDNPVNNQINGMSEKHRLYKDIYDFSSMWFDEHISPC